MIQKSDFFKHVLTLTSGTVIAQAIPIIFSPLLTRLYSPEEFGFFALFLSIVTILAVFTTGMYEMAIILPKKEVYAYQIRNISLFLTTFYTLIIILIIFSFYDLLITIFPPNINHNLFLFLIPFAVFLIGIYQTTIIWFNRVKNYKTMSKTGVIQSVTTIFFQVVFSLFAMGNLSLIFGRVIGQVVSTFYLLKTYYSSYSLRNKVSYKKTQYLAQVKRYKKFPYYVTWSKFFDISSNELPSVLILILFSPTMAGLYVIANKMISLPVSIIGLAVNPVHYKEISQMRNNHTMLKELTYNIYKKLVLLGFIPVSIILIFGDSIFQYIFGNNWLVSGEIAQILVIMFFIDFVIIHFNNILIIFEEQHKTLYFNILIFSVKVIAILVGFIIFNDIYNTILLYVICGVLIKITYMKYILNKIDISLYSALLFLIKYLTVAVVISFFFKLV